MATQTSLVAQQVRIRQWAEQIRNCQNRPKGMDVETWCTQNNLTKANYYYRLRRVRQICLDQMQDTETTAFVELPAPAPDPKKTDTPKESGTCISAGTLPMIWEGDGFLLMYKRLDNGAFRWPRSADEAMAITDDQYRMLMQGLEIVARHPISELKETPRIM